MAVSYRRWGMMSVFIVALLTATAPAQVCPSGWDCSCILMTPCAPSRATRVLLSDPDHTGYLNQPVDGVERPRADFDCGGRPNFLDFSKVKNAGLINQTAAACSTPIGP